MLSINNNNTNNKDTKLDMDWNLVEELPFAEQEALSQDLMTVLKFCRPKHPLVTNAGKDGAPTGCELFATLTSLFQSDEGLRASYNKDLERRAKRKALEDEKRIALELEARNEKTRSTLGGSKSAAGKTTSQRRTGEEKFTPRSTSARFSTGTRSTRHCWPICGNDTSGWRRSVFSPQHKHFCWGT